MIFCVNQWVRYGMVTVVLSLVILCGPVYGLEKYGRPLPAMETTVPTSDPLVHGYLLSAAFLDNPTFAARPDNSGLVGLRHMVHAETTLVPEVLQFYTDQNFFSNRKQGWVTLTEWDQVYAFTGSLDQWRWRIQYERDAPLDRSGLSQSYGDTLLTYTMTPLPQVTGYLGAGWLFYNHHYFARPDNTGRALYRYVAHADMDLYQQQVILFVDTNWFTDRTSGHAMRPSELDWMTGLAFRWGGHEVSLIHEEDTSLDHGGLVQRYTAIQYRTEWSW